MRPLFNSNNLSYSEEFIIHNSRTNILLRLLLLLGLAGAIIYCFWKNELINMLLLLAIFVYQIPILRKSLRIIDQVQFIINSDGIQYQNEDLISWNKIENERVVNERINAENTIDYFIYYIVDTGRIMKFDISELNTDPGTLQHALTIHRNRYIKNNTEKS